jgi:hypothetical protein
MSASTTTVRARWAAGLTGALALAWAAPGQALTIIPTFEASVTGASNAAEIEAAINRVTRTYDMFSNPVTVRIDFQLRDLGGNGGASYSSDYFTPFAPYRTRLFNDAAAHPENQVLALALANSVWGNTPASVGVDYINTAAADRRALGAAAAVGTLGADRVLGHGNFDGIVYLDNFSPDEYSFTETVGPNQDSGLDVLYHEVDEVLGIGGNGSTLNWYANGVNIDQIGPLDLYRYAAPHTPSFTTDPYAISYFSIDGGVHGWEYFNQYPAGDYGDWGRFACNDGLHYIQEWTGCDGEPFVPFSRYSPESVALQAIGYNLGMPEPATWTMLILGMGMTGHAARRRLRASAAA